MTTPNPTPTCGPQPTSHGADHRLYHRAWTHADATIDALELDTIGHVAWWPEDRNEASLHLNPGPRDSRGDELAGRTTTF